MSDAILIKSRMKDYRVSFVSDFLGPLQRYAEQSAFFIIDSFIHNTYGDQIGSFVPQERILVIEASEYNKTIIKCQEIIETLVSFNFRRNDRLVAIGGGVVQDITAFTASILYRGVEWSFFPTTLLAQADSCIGGKTSINLGDKKNLVGNFYPPSDIFIDTTALRSLTVDDIKSGIGEILHYYLYSASSLFDELIRDYELIIRDRDLLKKHIRESLKIKQSVIENDEFDRGERNKFNYGHTFGHAIESVTDYAIKHGQAVTLGMDLANYVSMKLGFMHADIFHNIHLKLSTNFPEFDWAKIDLDRYLNLLTKDKKNVGNNIGCILAKEPGVLFKKQLPLDNHFREIIQSYFSDELPDEEKA